MGGCEAAGLHRYQHGHPRSWWGQPYTHTAYRSTCAAAVPRLGAMSDSGDMFGGEPSETKGADPQPSAADLEAAGQSAMFGDPPPAEAPPQAPPPQAAQG